MCADTGILVLCAVQFIQDDNFFVEADSTLQLWCNALNEFLLDSHLQVTSVSHLQVLLMSISPGCAADDRLKTAVSPT